jgi:hypothetical protein
VIRWRLDPIGTGPLRRVRILADEKPVGVTFLTQGQIDDLTARLLTEAQAYARGYAEAVARLRDNDRYRNWWSADGAWQHAPTGHYWNSTPRGHLADYLETVGPNGPDVTAPMPCARCGDPVPAGQATHTDCAPVVCRFCTQCGKRLNGDERAAGCRVCLVSCAPLAEGINAADVQVRYDPGQIIQAADWYAEPVTLGPICPTGLACFGCRLCEASRQRAELEPGESEGPDIASSSTAEQPADEPLGPPPFVPEQRQGGEV